MKFAKIAIAAAAALALSGAAQAGTSTGKFNVTIKITGTCNAVAVTSGQAAAITTDTPTLSGADIDFGSHVAATGAAAINGNNVGGASSSIAVNCSKNTPYTIAMSPTNVASTVGLGKPPHGAVLGSFASVQARPSEQYLQLFLGYPACAITSK